MSLPFDPELLGLVAGSITTSAFVPQALRTIRTRSTRDLSLGMCVLFCTGTTLWLCYGLLLGALSVTLANAATLMLNLPILWLKLTEPGGVLGRRAGA
ncbi:MAG: SemiSWEET family sugar transporter [Alphaproteobacteria bacterium]|nr:SemiSWEET family sugar transporter [Alphaproteobacteria bacterium]